MLSDVDVDGALLAQSEIAVRVKNDCRHGGDRADLALLAGLQDALQHRLQFADAATTAWLRSVLLERQGRIPEAIGLLHELCDERDRARFGTVKPGLRAPITGLFPALAARLCTLLFQARAPETRIFDAIEWGKGRALADTHLEGRLPHATELVGLIAGRRMHYLTFLQDEDVVFAALLIGDGTLTTKRIPLGANEQAGVALSKMKAASGDLAAWQNDVAAVMAWLPGPCATGLIRPDDIVMVSPHGMLHSLPLHALPTADGLPLAPRVAVVRTHGVATAAAALVQRTEPLQGFVAVRAPTRRERDNPPHREGFAQVLRPLQAALGGDVLDGETADTKRLWAALRPAGVLHIMAHGDYDDPERFYDRSGVLLAYDGRLPPARDPEALLGPHLLSPKILDERCAGDPARLRDTHVTLLACVSGHSRANLQGDAVGLEWGFLLGGAASVLSSHWHVSFAAASAFCAFFYQAWLLDRKSRSRAWQHAVRRTAVEFPDTPAWACFSLSGLWT